MSKATVDKLGDLHGQVAEWMIAKLEELEPINAMTEQGPQTVGYKKAAKASDIAVMTKFLNDNNVTADVDTNRGLGELQQRLAKNGKRSDNVTALPGVQQAADGFVGQQYG